MAGMTFTLTHEPFDVFTHKLALGFFVPSLKIRDNTLVGTIIITTTIQSDPIFLTPRPKQDFLQIVRMKLFHRHLHAKPMRFSHCCEAFHIPSIAINSVIRPDGSLGNGEIGVKYKIRIYL